jgi:hypothetical protein
MKRYKNPTLAQPHNLHMFNLCLLVGTLPKCGAKLVVLFFDFVLYPK